MPEQIPLDAAARAEATMTNNSAQQVEQRDKIALPEKGHSKQEQMRANSGPTFVPNRPQGRYIPLL